MGAFNRVRLQDRCACHKGGIERWIQFKYGDCWQYDYSVGDTLRWGGNDKGIPGAARVVVLGTGEDCLVCGCAEDTDYEVWIRDDRITDVKRATNYFERDYVPDNLGYILLDGSDGKEDLSEA